MKMPKKFENFLYYHKYHVIIIFFLFIVLSMFISDHIKTTHYDYTIGIITKNPVSTSSMDSLKSWLSTKGEDLNSDGAVQINLVNYVLSDSSTSYDITQNSAGLTHLIADFNSQDSMIFIYSDEIYDKLEDKNLFDINTHSIIKLNQCSEILDSDIYNLNISLRTLNPDKPFLNNSREKYYYNCKTLFSNITKIT